MSENLPDDEEYPVTPTAENVSLPLPVSRTSFLGETSSEKLEEYKKLQAQISRQMIPQSNTSLDKMPSWAKPLAVQKQKSRREEKQHQNLQEQKQKSLQDKQSMETTFHQKVEHFEAKEQSLKMEVSNFHFPFEERKKSIQKRSESIHNEYQENQRIIRSLGKLF